MNGKLSDPGLQSTDACEPSNRLPGVREAFRIIRTAKATLEAFGEFRLAREIEDALARFGDTEARQIDAFPPGPAGEGQRGSEGVHGEDPPEAQVG